MWKPKWKPKTDRPVCLVWNKIRVSEWRKHSLRLYKLPLWHPFHSHIDTKQPLSLFLCLSLEFSSSVYFGLSTQICVVVVVVVVLRSYDEELSVYQRRSLRSSVFDGKHNPLRSSELSFPLHLFLLSTMFLHIIICYIRYGRVERRGDDRNSCLSIHWLS